MKLIYILILCLAGIGCEQITPPIFGKSPSPKPPDQSIEELTRYAKVNGYWWRIFCVDNGKMQFQAEICKAECGKLYIEEGGKGRWASQGHTQIEAARNVIYGRHEEGYFIRPSWLAPDHAPTFTHKQCPPELHGGPQ